MQSNHLYLLKIPLTSLSYSINMPGQLLGKALIIAAVAKMNFSNITLTLATPFQHQRLNLMPPFSFLHQLLGWTFTAMVKP